MEGAKDIIEYFENRNKKWCVKLVNRWLEEYNEIIEESGIDMTPIPGRVEDYKKDPELYDQVEGGLLNVDKFNELQNRNFVREYYFIKEHQLNLA